MFYSFILVPDDYTHIFNATEYNVTVFQKDATEDSTLLYFKIFIKENVVTDLGILILVSDTHPFLIGSSGSLNTIYPIDTVDEIQIIEDTIVAGNDVEVGVHTFALTARVVISGVLQEEVVNVIINVKGKKYGFEVYRNANYYNSFKKTENILIFIWLMM